METMTKILRALFWLAVTAVLFGGPPKKDHHHCKKPWEA